MNRDTTLLLVGGIDETVRKAKRLGLHVLLLQHPSKLTAEQEELADVLHVLDFTEWSQIEPVVAELWERPGFAVALSLTEPGLENAGRINDKYGLGGTSYEVAHRIRDKWAMRRHLADVEPAVAAMPLRDREDLDVFAGRTGYPFIVKPVDGTASLGVFRVDGPEDVDRVWSRVDGLRGVRTDRVSTLFVLQDFLMEEYVDGPEYSVEAFSFASRHSIVAVTEKFVDQGTFAELGHVVPARIPAETEARIRAAVRRFLDAVGLRDGVSHTEVRVGPRGPVIIESHNRIAGDAITDLVVGAYGIDLTTYAVGWPFGLVAELPADPQPHRGACVRFLVGEPGRVSSVDGVDAALSEPDVLVARVSAKPGDEVRPLRDNWDRLGLVGVSAADSTAAIERAAELIRDTIDIRIAGADGREHRARVAEPASRSRLTGSAA
ncbi:ATP-grasp domain-containing protein [Micromonospora sp. NPDC006766]|uniref:ATP-grasp domain-containing protein n=1 Tax=Micromonospora sp. NPDC006766 TaxID=3154778 RepID=UPI0033DE1B67